MSERASGSAWESAARAHPALSCLATDFDGTIARDGVVEAVTLAALRRWKESGRRLLLVTGRELDELIQVFPEITLFDHVVAENGAVLFDPASKHEEVLTGGPSQALVERLRQAGITDVSVGRSIVATWKPHETIALEAIRDLGLELHIVFNKEAVMILPSTVSKATGLEAALKRLDLPADAVIGVGDAENDHAFISLCGYAVAVENAIQSLKQEVDWVTPGARGQGVVELIDAAIAGRLPPARRKSGRRTA